MPVAAIAWRARTALIQQAWRFGTPARGAGVAVAGSAGAGPRPRRPGEPLRSGGRRNPPLRGIQWLSGIELGMRLIAWVWTRRLLANWPGVQALFEGNPEFLQQLHH